MIRSRRAAIVALAFALLACSSDVEVEVAAGSASGSGGAIAIAIATSSSATSNAIASSTDVSASSDATDDATSTGTGPSCPGLGEVPPLESLLPRDIVADAQGDTFTALVSVDDASLYLAKRDPTGAVLWTVALANGAFGKTARVAAAPNGDFGVVGTFQGAMMLPCGGAHAVGVYDAFFARVDTNGAPLDVETFGAGGTTTFGAGVGFEPNSDVVVATNTQTDATTHSADLFRVGASDEAVWDTKLDGASVGALAMDPAGDVLAFSVEGADAVATKLDSNGAIVFSDTYAGGHFVEGLDVDASGGFVVTGIAADAVTFGAFTLAPGSYLVRFAPDGSVVWAHQLTTNAEGDLARFDKSGAVVLASNYVGTLAIDGDPIDTTANDSIFVARFDESGTLGASAVAATGALQGLAVEPNDEIALIAVTAAEGGAFQLVDP